jgi:protein involved in polysaccharide export with SLBB domain
MALVSTKQTSKYKIVRHLFTLFFAIYSFSALALQPTPEQLEQFKRMSPAEQSRIAEQFGIDVSQFDGGGARTPVVVEETTVLPRDLEQQKKMAELDEALKADAKDIKNEEPLKLSELKPFGYDLFAGTPTTYSPITDVPVSSDYVLGPGDSLKVHAFGKTSQSYELVIDQEGSAYIPKLGPISFAGQTFAEAKQYITDFIDQKMIGVKVSVSMGQLRSIRVFVLGEAYMPGSYVVSSLSTITNALVLSGGVSESGSLRNIQLKRKGKLIQTLDVYDLLLRGDTTNDAQLKSGDVIFIPQVGATVGIQGEVRRVAKYEIADKETTQMLIQYAGGLLSSAYPQAATLERINQNNERTLLSLNLKDASDLQENVQNGDMVFIPKVLEKIENVVKLSGHLYRDRTSGWRQGLRLSDVVPEIKRLKPNPDLNYGLIKRYRAPYQKLEVLAFSLGEALQQPGSESDVLLENQDEILIFGLYEYEESDERTETNLLTRRTKTYGSVEQKDLSEREQQELFELEQQDIFDLGQQDVFDLGQQDVFDLGQQDVFDSKRQEAVAKIIEQLRAQSSINTPSREVAISGDVRYPGIYPLVADMQVNDLIYAAGGLTEKAFQLRAELSRKEFNKQQERNQYRVDLNLTSSDSLAVALKSRDELHIKTIPEWAESEKVTLSGEVKFPGTYTVYKNDTLALLLERAGGLTAYAYAPGAMFTRVELKAQQAQQLKEMQERLAEDIAKAELSTLNNKNKSGDVGQAQNLLSQLKNTPAKGRLVIDLEKVVAGDTEYTIPLQKGDALHIPIKKNSVTIIGEVQLPISQIYESQLDYWEYINRSGGTTDKADEDRVYIIKANGGVQIPESSNWFASNHQQIAPGDTIVVPLDPEKLDQIELWSDLSQIFYQIALGAAAVNSF